MGPESNPPSIPQITLDQVSVTLGLRTDRRGKVLRPGTPVLKACSWQIQTGDRWAIVGRAGSGKTTLLRLLNRLIDPTQGRLSWQGIDYRQIPIQTLRRQILYVPQEPKLLNMSVAEAIAYPLHLQKLASADITQRCADIIDRLQIPTTWLDQHEIQLSQNQRQWVAIARALALAPPVLLLDQPTLLLDPAQISCLQLALKDGAARTVIITGYSPDHLDLAIDHCYRLDSDRAPSSSDFTEENW